MTQEELKSILKSLMLLPAECEWVEFKKAENSFDFSELGQYVSAISNESYLRNQGHGWLIFGIQDNPRKIVGTNYRTDRKYLDKLKEEIANKTNNRITFIEIHELITPEGRVIMFQVPAAPPGIPTSWEGHFYGRDGESIVPLSLSKLESIRKGESIFDWSGQICEGSDINSIDDNALEFLRDKISEIHKDDKYLKLTKESLLNALQLLKNGLPNNTCILFLGKREIAEKLLPEISQITWKYTDIKNNTNERLQFRAPFLPALYQIQTNINRFNTFLRDFDLFRVDIKQYEDKAIEELLVNSLAHRDWTIKLWVEIVQTPTEVTFRNPGIFRANLDEALKNNLRPPYINQKMAEFLQKLNLMEKEGGGLQTVYSIQLRKGTRIIPTFHTSQEYPRVDFSIKGKIDNVAFARLVLSKKEIKLEDLILLDRIVSGRNKIGNDISSDDAERLKKQNYIEVRGIKYKKCFISEDLAETIGQTGKYIVQKGFTKEQKIQYIMNYIERYGHIKLKDAKGMFENFSESSMKHLLSIEMCKKGLIKRIQPSSKKTEWYYIKA